VGFAFCQAQHRFHVPAASARGTVY